MNYFAYRRAKWFGIAADAAINYTDHDKRYHRGNFDPKTMTCEMREAEAKGDLVDVLNAEQAEAEYKARQRKSEFQKGKTARELYGDQAASIQKAREKLAADGKGNALLPDDAVVLRLGNYFGKWKELVHGLREGDDAAIAEAARIFAERIPADSVIVPMPSHNGRATTMLRLANAIAEKSPGVTVADVLSSSPHESSYEQKKRGELPTPIQMYTRGSVPAGRPVYVLDNVVGSGVTAASALKALPKGTAVLAVSDTLQGTAKKLFGPPPQPPQVQMPQRPRVEPVWSRKAREEHPAKVVMDGEGKPVVSFDMPQIPKRLEQEFGKRQGTVAAVKWMVGERSRIDGEKTPVQFDASRISEYCMSGWTIFLSLIRDFGTREELESNKNATVKPKRGDTAANHTENATAKPRPGNTAANRSKDAIIIPQSVGGIKAGSQEFSDASKAWASRTLRAKIAAIPYLKEIIANATDGKHLTQAQMTAATSERHSSRKQGSAWGGGCHFYDVRFSVPDEDGTPRTYKGRLMLREDADGNRFMYDVLDLDDRSGFTQYFKATQNAKHAQQDAERGVVREAK